MENTEEVPTTREKERERKGKCWRRSEKRSKVFRVVDCNSECVLLFNCCGLI